MTTIKTTKIAAGDVVRHSGSEFNRLYPEAVGVVESVTRESNGVFADVTWTVDLGKLPARSRATAKANGASEDFHQFTGRHVALRFLHEIK